MQWKGLRLGVQGIVVRDGELLLVNAFAPGKDPDLWCAPGGGTEPQASLLDNLIREIHEETGLNVQVGAVAPVNEFHSPEAGFHQRLMHFVQRILYFDKNVVAKQSLTYKMPIGSEQNA